MREPSWGDHLRPVPEMSQGSAQTGRRYGRGSALLRPCRPVCVRVACCGMAPSGAHAPRRRTCGPRPVKCEQSMPATCLPPLISGAVVQRTPGDTSDVRQRVPYRAAHSMRAAYRPADAHAHTSCAMPCSCAAWRDASWHVASWHSACAVTCTSLPRASSCNPSFTCAHET